MKRKQLQEMPGKWEICDHCAGHGKSSAYLGAFTREQMDEDPDFARDYMDGHYDRTCDNCGGSGKTWLVNISRCTFSQKRELATHRRNLRWDAESRAEQIREMRMLGEWED